jgi:AraC-like DNA-binding protein
MKKRPSDQTIRDAFAKHRTLEATAQALDVSRRTLARWIRADLALASCDRARVGRQPTIYSTPSPNG